ncbi:penicillin-binding protein 2 [Niastella koreensis]|uniref:Peptidoglycan glycosyltransferase n=2 Tax=Niastella koreensis TaxID=354356 RepID=G8TAV8_NIAKG|nr:penicillin-binding protein 2 [Niastella koreensis]AEW00301.1 Peptidoglycan glycosyltransferase [Niastella koreensis GR20-10]OQP52169.1 penicillin-binding protein 2 [Niastella koreensis]
MATFNQSRTNIIRLILITVFLIIVAQLFNLQVLSGKYRKDAFRNAVFPKVKYPDRGIIFDRKGKAILNNVIMYDLVVTPNEVKTVDTTELCSLLGIDLTEFNKRLHDARIRNGGYRPSLFAPLLSEVVHVRLDENIWKYPGFTLVERPVRVYPYNAGAHILGYIGEADSAIIKRSGGFYRTGDYVGRAGLENSYESVLMGQRGVEYLLKDNHNRLVGSYENGSDDTAAIAGRNLRTYLDIELQMLAEKLLRGKVGAVVALDPKTGGVLAMASSPNFNPNDLAGAARQKNYSRLVLDVASPMLNRGIKGLYPPGSTYKPMGALIALEEGLITPASSYDCHGTYYGCNRPQNCTEKQPGHAASLRLAIAWSCNSFFSDVIKKTIDNPAYNNPRQGLTAWKTYMTAFGMGHRTGIDLPSEDGGNIPDTTQYDKAYRGLWNSCTMTGGGLGIGQDKMLATPLQIANSACIIANKGYYYTPHLVAGIDGENETDTLLKKYRIKHEVLTHISPEVYNVVTAGMQDVVEHGTAKNARIAGINMCAKTGTAQNKIMLDGNSFELYNHSTFVCFAPREDPRIAIAVVVENAGSGASFAAPIASLLVEKYLRDSLSTERLKKVEEIAATNKMPDYLGRVQYKADSTRGFQWFKLTKDSSYIRNYLKPGKPYTPPVLRRKR